jgi:hypothetical protein
MNKFICILSGTFGFGFLLIFSTFVLSFGTSTIKSSTQEHGWTLGSPMPTPRTEIAAALLDGKIYVVGGKTKTFMILLQIHGTLTFLHCHFLWIMLD